MFKLVLEGILASSSGSRAMILLVGDGGELEVAFEKVGGTLVEEAGEAAAGESGDPD